MSLYKRDPRWQTARAILVSDLPGMNHAARRETQLAAIQTMSEIEAAYDADPPPVPPTSFELTGVHDTERCRARRLAALRAELAHMESELAELRAAGQDGRLTAATVACIEPAWAEHADQLRALLPADRAEPVADGRTAPPAARHTNPGPRPASPAIALAQSSASVT